MQVSALPAYTRIMNRFGQLRPLASKTSAPQWLIDTPGLKVVDKTSVPALSQLCWPAMDVEHSRKMLQGMHTLRDSTSQSIEHWSKSIKTAETLIAKYGPISPLLAMIDSAKSSLQELARRARDEDIEIDRLTTQHNEKIAAPAYQQWLSRQAQAGHVSSAQDPAAPSVNEAPAQLSVVC